MPDKKNIESNVNSREEETSLSFERTPHLLEASPDTELSEENLDEVVGGKGKNFPIIKKIAKVVAPMVG